MRRLVLIGTVIAACGGGMGDQATITTSQQTAATSAVVRSGPWDLPDPFVGFSLSPRAFDQAGLDDFFDMASASGSLVAWVGPWQDIDQGGGLVTSFSGERDLVPVVVTGFPTEEGMRVLPDDPSALIDALSGFVGEHPVPYLGLGVEINTFLWERSPEEFDRFTGIFDQAADAVHAASPETRVFPIFQLERLRGLKGGLFGESATEPEWELIDRFQGADAIGFTTYPGLVFTDPGELPEDYYTEILEHVDRPVVFTEVGWQANGDFGDWSGTSDKQASYVSNRIPEIADLADMVIWSFLWDQEAAPGAFASMGLISSEGERRPALDRWQDSFG